MPIALNIFSEGGGLIDDVDGTILVSKVIMFDYGDLKGGSRPSYHASIDVDGTTFDQYWSCGGANEWKPSPDGKSIDPIGSGTELRKNANASILFASMIAANPEVDKLLGGGDVSKLVGLKAHWLRVPAPKRGGVGEKRKAPDGKEYDNTILTVSRVLALPGAGGGKSVGGGNNSAAADGIKDTLLELLANTPEGIQRKSLPAGLLKATAGKCSPAEVLRLLKNDEWITSVEGVTIADGVVKLG